MCQEIGFPIIWFCVERFKKFLLVTFLKNKTMTFMLAVAKGKHVKVYTNK